MKGACNGVNTQRERDEFFMRRCLALAEKGRGAVSPNPMVGCVIVHENEIIAEGYHRQYGGPHAEVEAIENARQRGLSHLFSSSTLYVSLEPCSHYGKTPPCAVKVVECGFKRVVAACGDPNPEVSGRGFAYLREAGIEVTTGVLEEEARFLNRRFMTYILEKRPYVILKWAQTSDGFMAGVGGKAPCAITDARLQVENHKLRVEEDALWVGAHTLLSDNPRLSPRLYEGRPPCRVAVDLRGGLPLGLHFFDGSQPTILFTTEALAKGEYASVGERVKLVAVPTDTSADATGRVPTTGASATAPCAVGFDTAGSAAAPTWMSFVLAQLHAAGLGSVVVEGGAKLLQQLIRAGLYDEVRVFESAAVMGRGYAAPALPKDVRSYQPDTVYEPAPDYPVAQRIHYYIRTAARQEKEVRR